MSSLFVLPGSGDFSFLGFASWIRQALYRSSDPAFLLPSCRNAVFVRHAPSRSSKRCVSLLYMYMTLDSSILSPISTVPLMVLSHCSRLNAFPTQRQRQRLHSQLLRASAILTKEEPRQAPTLILSSAKVGEYCAWQCGAFVDLLTHFHPVAALQAPVVVGTLAMAQCRQTSTGTNWGLALTTWRRYCTHHFYHLNLSTFSALFIIFHNILNIHISVCSPMAESSVWTAMP